MLSDFTYVCMYAQVKYNITNQSSIWNIHMELQSPPNCEQFSYIQKDGRN
jgi:hypothetical protein